MIWHFGTWLARAMFERDQQGCEAMHVVLVPKEDGLGGFARHWGEHDEAATRWRLWHIVMPLIPLAGPKTTVTLCGARDGPYFSDKNIWKPEGRSHFMGPLVLASKAGNAIPKFAATDAARRHVASWFTDKSRVVTLTTRSQANSTERNSSIDEWTKMEKWLAPRFEVVRLRDTAVGLACDTGPWALLDPDLRLALYERAQMNLIGNNGPSTLLKFSAAPYLSFGEAPTKQWEDHCRKFCNMEPGEQVPWARPDQRMVYQPDRFEVMRDHFTQWEQRSLA